MEAEYTKQGNKLISEFMGYPITISHHYSWHSIMKVVKKINDLNNHRFHFIIYGAVAEVTDTLDMEMVCKTSITDREPKIIEAVWETIFQFIEWYNTQ